MTKQGMMLVVDDLEARGYLRRVADPEDARAKVVRLTAHGRRAAAETGRALAAIEVRTKRQLGDRRFDALRESLEALITPGEPAAEARPVDAEARERKRWGDARRQVRRSPPP